MKYNKILQDQAQKLSEAADNIGSLQDTLNNMITDLTDGLTPEAKEFVMKKMSEARAGKIDIKDIDKLAKEINGKINTGNK